MSDVLSNETVMDAETLEALRGSIAKWEGIVDGTMTDEGPFNCPLCRRFNDRKGVSNDCQGCPVMARTGHRGCLESPYQTYDDYIEHCDWNDIPIDKSHAKALAQAELDFLKSLLPSEALPALKEVP
jgi:hypothetical protein